MDFDTIILRFRDLSVGSGETIETHKAEIATHGHTWWAWWNKAGEQVPEDAFRELVEKTHSSSPDAFSIYLFDTGQSKFYKATLLDIFWSNLRQKVDSPDRDATPPYYAQTAYLAWFKLSSIEEVPQADLLDKFTYVSVPALFDTNKSVFQEFYGKKVKSGTELRHQERTIWFIRPSVEGDRSHEILLVSQGSQTPRNFSRDIIDLRTGRLVWLSDLHFSLDHHAFALQRQVDEARLPLADRLDAELKRDDTSPGAILITGDLTWKATPEEFDLCAKFIEDLRSRWSLKPDQIVVCPGNHDLAFTDKPWDKAATVEYSPDHARRAYSDFHERIFGCRPPEYLATGRRFLAKGRYIEIVGLNSSTLRQQPNVFQGQGYLGEEQLAQVAAEMGWEESKGEQPLRIALLHHQISSVVPRTHPVYEEAFTPIWDLVEFEDWLARHRIRLVLHGHMHAHGHRGHTVSRPDGRSAHSYDVVGLGSAGVTHEHIPEHRSNMFGYVDVEADSLTVKLIEIRPNGQVSDVDRIIAEYAI